MRFCLIIIKHVHLNRRGADTGHVWRALGWPKRVRARRATRRRCCCSRSASHLPSLAGPSIERPASEVWDEAVSDIHKSETREGKTDRVAEYAAGAAGSKKRYIDDYLSLLNLDCEQRVAVCLSYTQLTRRACLSSL